MTTQAPLRRADKAWTDDAARALFRSVPHVHLAAVTDAGEPLLRAVHIVEHRGRYWFHGALRGEKVAVLRGPVVLSAVEVVAEIPSHFTHPERACPATTFFRSAMVHGTVEEVTFPEQKADALQVLMERFQPGGGHRPITATDPMYTKAIAGVRLWAVTPERVVGKQALGHHKPQPWKERALAGLWQAGQTGPLGELSRAWGLPVAAGPAGTGLWLGSEANLPGVLDLLRDQYWTADVDLAVLRRAQLGSPAWLVARSEEGEVVGTARAISDGGRLAHLMDVAVHPGWQGIGVGAALVRLLLQHPSVRGCRKVTLRTRDAGSFYARLGFVRREDPQPSETWMRCAE